MPVANRLGGEGDGFKVAMAANLAKAGHEVRAFDPDEAALERARANGCITFANLREAVSGGIAAVNSGTLTFMVGGTEADFARAEPILAAMDKAVIHAGANGARQAAKICHNMLLGASMVATCEAFRLAERLGLDLQTFYDISSKASGRCWSMTFYCPVPMGHRAEELYIAFDTAGMAGWIFRPLSRRFERRSVFRVAARPSSV